MKISEKIGILASIVSIIGGIGAGIIFLDDKYGLFGDNQNKPVASVSPPESQAPVAHTPLPQIEEDKSKSNIKTSETKETPVRQQQIQEPSVKQPTVTQPESRPRQTEQVEVVDVKTSEPVVSDPFKEGLKLYNAFKYQQAYSYFTKAANQGNSSAQYYIGKMYLDGNGVVKNLETAFSYINKAAGSGNKLAYFDLAEMYNGGLGVAKNKTMAKTWYQKAADNGNDLARRRIEKM